MRAAEFFAEAAVPGRGLEIDACDWEGYFVGAFPRKVWRPPSISLNA